MPPTIVATAIIAPTMLVRFFSPVNMAINLSVNFFILLIIHEAFFKSKSYYLDYNKYMTSDTLVQPTKKQPFTQKVIYGLSILTILAAALLIIFAVVGYSQDKDQTQALEEQTRKTNELIEQERKVSQQAANYAYCNAVLLSQYTQNQVPITIEDLNTCVLTSYPDSTVTGPDGVIMPSGSSSPATSTTPSNTTNRSTATPAPVSSNPTPSPIAPTPTNPVNPQPTTTNPEVSTTPNSILPGINVDLPCLNAVNLIQLSCS